MAGTLRRIGGILFSLALVLCFVPANAEPTFPALTGRVVDDANLLDPADEQALTADLKALEDKSSDQVVVVTVPSLQGYAIEDYGYQLGRHWGIGTKQLSNGVLLIVAPNERKVRIEVGRGIEPTSPTRCRRSSLKMRSCPCPFRKLHPAWIRMVRQNHRIIECDVCNPARARNVRRRPVQVEEPA